MSEPTTYVLPADPYRSDGDYWFGIECDDKFNNLYMARVSRTILRVGWSL